MLKIGDQAPDFNAEDQNDNHHRLTDLLETGQVVLYFYPADFTPICTAQACAIRDRSKALTGSSIQILGASPQSAASHRRFAKTYELPFPLLSDENKTIIRAYGVAGPLGFGVRRATFLIGTDGRIANRVVADFLISNHMDLINKVLVQQDQPAP